MIIQRFNLNLIPNQSPVIVHVNQYDTGTGRLVATLYEGNEPYSPNGTAVIQGTKPDGHGFQYTATLDGNVVTADLTEQMSPVAGDVRAQIVVTESSGVTGTFVFIMRVQPSALPSDTEMSESDYQYIEEAIREAQEAVQTAQEATETAQEAVQRAEAAITETQENAEDSEAWAQGTRGGIPVDPTDPTYEHNAEYWAQYAERYAQGGLHYKASIPFANIPTTGMREGDMYDITDDFTTDSRFTEGAGIEVKGGTNIAWNSDNKWDVLALPPKTTFNGRSGSILPMAGDYDSEKILLASVLHIGGETQNDVQEALEALENNKADRVDGAVADNFAGLDADGNLKDSGKKASDFATPSDIAGQQSLLKDTVGWTGKNLLKNEGSIVTHLGVTFTVNPDGSITANGTSTGVSNYVLVTDLSKYQGLGDLYLTGCPEDGGESKYEIIVCNSDGVSFYHSATDRTKVRDFGNGTSLNVDTIQSANSTPVNLEQSSIRILTRKDQTVNNLTFYPMIRKADITDPTYEPYHESVEVMYEEEIHGVNLLKNIGTSRTVNGITFTVNADGSVTANGTATAFAGFTIARHSDKDSFNYEGYIGKALILSGCPANGSISSYKLRYDRVVSDYSDDYGEGLLIVPDANYANSWFIEIAISSGVTVNNLVFRPMLRLAAIEDSTYRPYNSQAIQNQINAQGVLGAKNLLPNNGVSQTINGVTFTVNDDGSITANGTATAVANFNIPLSISGTLSCILNGCPSGGSDNSYRIGARYNNSGTLTYNYDTGSGCEINDISIVDRVFIQIASGQTVNNLTFKPMLRLASDPDDTYQPYAMTNKELTEKANTYGMLLPPTTDLNDIIKNGIYYANNITTNAPTGISSNYYGLIVMAWNNSNVRQLLVAKDAIYTRSKGGSPVVWSSWYKYTGTVVS